MNRYSLDIFKNPVMHDKGQWVKFSCVSKKMTDLIDKHGKLHEEKARLSYQYNHALKVATEAQTELRKINLQSNVLCCLVVVLVVVESWLISGMF